MQEVFQITRVETVGLPAEEAPAPNSPAAQAKQRLEQLLDNFHLGHMSEIASMLDTLRNYPQERLNAIAKLATCAAPHGEPGREITRRALAGAARIAELLGRPEEAASFTHQMLTFDGDERAHTLLAYPGSRPDQALERAAQCLMFRALSDPTKRAIESAVSLRKYRKNDYLCVQDNPADVMFIIRSGRVAILHRLADKEFFLRYRNPSETIGELALYTDDEKRTASCRAVEDTEAWTLDYEQLRTLLSAPQHQDLKAHLDALFFERQVESSLAQHPLCADLGPSARVKLAALATRRASAPEGTKVQSEGAPIKEVLLLLKGELTERFENAPAVSVTHHSQPPTFLGLSAVLHDTAWPGNLIATREAWTAAFEVSALREFTEAHPLMRLMLPSTFFE